MKPILTLVLAAVLFTAGHAASAPGHPGMQAAIDHKQAILSLEQFFRSYDTAVLRRLNKPVAIIDDGTAARTSSSTSDINYMQAKNNELIPLLAAINPVTYNPAGLSASDEMLVYAGVLELYNQLRVSSGKSVTDRAAFPWNCIRDVILSAFNISTIFVEFQAMIAGGASWATVRPFLWQNLRRYGGWFTVAGVVWDIATQCFKL